MRALGFAAGAAFGIASLFVAMNAASVPRGDGTLGLDVTVIANSTGEIHVTAPGVVLRGAGLAPGDLVTGRMTVRNITPEPLEVSIQALPSIRDLDDILMVEIRAGPRTVYRGPLGGLVVGVPAVGLAPGAASMLDVRFWLPAHVTDGYQGRIADVTLAFGGSRSGPS